MRGIGEGEVTRVSIVEEEWYREGVKQITEGVTRQCVGVRGGKEWDK